MYLTRRAFFFFHFADIRLYTAMPLPTTMLISTGGLTSL